MNLVYHVVVSLLLAYDNKALVSECDISIIYEHRDKRTGFGYFFNFFISLFLTACLNNESYDILLEKELDLLIKYVPKTRAFYIKLTLFWVTVCLMGLDE